MFAFILQMARANETLVCSSHLNYPQASAQQVPRSQAKSSQISIESNTALYLRHCLEGSLHIDGEAVLNADACQTVRDVVDT